MNPYDVQSLGHKTLRTILAEPINGLSGGYIVYNTAQYPATGSCFEIVQSLEPGGLVPKLMGDAIVSKSDLPSTVVFKSLQNVTVVLPGGGSHDCVIQFVRDLITEWQLVLWDKAQGA